MAGLVDSAGSPLLPPSPTNRFTAPFGSRYSWGPARRIYNPDNLTFATYERMVDTDETVGTALEFIELTVNAYIGEYFNPKKRIQSFVRENLEKMRPDLADVVAESLSCLWVGHSDLELVFAERDGRLWIDDLPAIHPEFLTYELETEGRNTGHIKSIHQIGIETPIPANKVMHMTHRGRWGNPYGKSRLKGVYQSWFIKTALRIAGPQTLERYGSPIGVGRPQAPDQVEANGSTRAENMLTALQNLQNNSSLVLPPGDMVEFIQIPRAFGGDFLDFENHHNRMIFRGLLMPSLVFENGDIGSFAMAKKHFEVFLRSIFRLVNQVCRALVQQVVRPLVVLNFGERDTYGNFQRQTLEEEDLEIWSKIFFAMIGRGVIRPEEEADFLWMREKFGAPKGVEPREFDPAILGGGGQDGIPGAAPDGQDDNSMGNPSGSGGGTPGRSQGRPSSMDEDEADE